MKRKGLSLTIAAFLTVLTARAQLVVDNVTYTPNDLVTQILLGNGVTASNITFQGDLNQYGYFDGSASNIGIPNGVIMGSGDVTVAVGPNTQGGATLGGGNFGIADPDLDMLIAPNTTNDRATLEFDFIPTGDSISFKFVFASEEYDEYACGTVNDAFGFFLSGPGITGPHSSPAAFPNGSVNLAVVPGGNIPISINTVNLGVAGMNGQAQDCAALDPNWQSNNIYYTQNANGATVEYDGFTVVMTAKAQVTCGLTYHIKLAIADGGDTAFDSGVFLQGGSFSSTGLVVDADIDFGSNDSTLYEGCGVAEMIFSRNNNINGTDSIFIFTTGSTATNGVDHTIVPDTMVFLPGQDSLYLNISAIDDGITEGIETVEIMAVTYGQCTNDTAFFTIYIDDVPPLLLNVSNDTSITCNDSVQVWASASGGFNVLTYTWTNGPFQPGDTSAWVSPAVTTTYYVSITDTCNGQTISDSIVVTVPIYPPLVVDAGVDETVFCPETSVTLSASATGGLAPYTWDWGGLSNTSDLAVSPPDDQMYTVTVTDTCGNVATDDVMIIVDYDTLSIVITPDAAICLDDSITLSVIASDGTLPYSYNWDNGDTTASFTVAPTATTNYQVVVNDACDISVVDDVTVGVQSVDAEFTHAASAYVINSPIQFYDQSSGAVTNWNWTFGNDESSTYQHPSTTYDPDGDYWISLVVSDDLGCIDSVTYMVTILPEMQIFIPNSFTPNGDGMNDFFHAKGINVVEFELVIYDRWGHQVFQSESIDNWWDGTHMGQPVPIGVYVYTVRALSLTDDEVMKKGHVTVVR